MLPVGYFSKSQNGKSKLLPFLQAIHLKTVWSFGRRVMAAILGLLFFFAPYPAHTCILSWVAYKCIISGNIEDTALAIGRSFSQKSTLFDLSKRIYQNVYLLSALFNRQHNVTLLDFKIHDVWAVHLSTESKNRGKGGKEMPKDLKLGCRILFQSKDSIGTKHRMWKLVTLLKKKMNGVDTKLCIFQLACPERIVSTFVCNSIWIIMIVCIVTLTGCLRKCT